LEREDNPDVWHYSLQNLYFDEKKITEYLDANL